MWNQNINLFYAQKIKELYPDTLTIAGGPNFSNDRDDRKIFLEDHPYLDFFIVGEGEIPSCNIIQNYINVGKNIKKLKEIDLVSTITLLPDGTMKEAQGSRGEGCESGDIKTDGCPQLLCPP